MRRRIDTKKLLIHFAGCGHSRVVDRYDAARVIKGTEAECLKCSERSFEPITRRIAEQSWVDAKKMEEP